MKARHLLFAELGFRLIRVSPIDCFVAAYHAARLLRMSNRCRQFAIFGRVSTTAQGRFFKIGDSHLFIHHPWTADRQRAQTAAQRRFDLAEKTVATRRAAATGVPPDRRSESQFAQPVASWHPTNQRSVSQRKMGDGWRFNLCRRDYSKTLERPELSCCSPLSRADFHYYEEYATLQFVGQPEEPQR